MTNKQQSLLSIPIAVVKRLVLTTCLLVLPVTIQSCTLPAQSIDITGAKKMQAKNEKMKFMFADDETEEAAQKKLVQTFPVGSDLNNFVTMMKLMQDVKCSENTTITGSNYQITSCEYFIPTDGAATYRWYISASNQQGKITKIYINKYFTPYYPPNVDYHQKVK
jgi:hypothetical protein